MRKAEYKNNNQDFGNMPINFPSMDNVIEGDFREVDDNKNEKEETGLVPVDKSSAQEPYYEIVKAVPLSITAVKSEKGTVVTMAWFCQSKDGNFYTINSNYLMDAEEIEMEMLRDLPIFTDNLFISQKVLVNMLMEGYKIYVTDMQFSSACESLNENEKFYFEAFELKSKQKFNFYISNNLFASISYVDNYISESIINNYEFNMASVSAANDHEIEIVKVENIINIISIAPTDTKFTSIAVVAQIFGNGKEFTILVPFSTESKFKKNKFRDMTVKKLEETYLKDKDQYLNVFTFVTTLKNLDKEFMIIKGKNKAEEEKLFLLDSNMRQKLADMVAAF